MRLSLRVALLSTVALLAPLGAATAQQPTTATPAQPAPALPLPAVGDMAPDFVIRNAATRYGLLREPTRLSDFRGQTVVLWLFIKARTRG